jgi:uncharacterized membrane protein YfcA
LTLDAVFLAAAIPAVLLAGISKGGFGSGAAFAATPILALVMAPGQALALMMPLLLVMDAASLRPYWRRWDGGAARLLILGGVPGVALGWMLLAQVDPDVFRLMIGTIAVGYVGWQAGRAAGWIVLRPRPVGAVAGLFWGFVAGFTSFISHAGGPPAAVYMLARGLGKTAFQATTVIVFTVTNVLKAVAFAALGLFTPEMLGMALLLAPVAVFGTWIGVRAHHWIPERAFFALTSALLLIAGAKLILDGLA